MAFRIFSKCLKRSAFYLRYQPKAERVQRLSIALHFAKICDSGFSRNALISYESFFLRWVRTKIRGLRGRFEVADHLRDERRSGAARGHDPDYREGQRGKHVPACHREAEHLPRDFVAADERRGHDLIEEFSRTEAGDVARGAGGGALPPALLNP